MINRRDMRMEEKSRRQRRMEASCEGGQGPEGAVAPWIGEWVGGRTKNVTRGRRLNRDQYVLRISVIYPISSPAPKLQSVRGLLIVTGAQ
jgi:hypothetical protein